MALSEQYQDDAVGGVAMDAHAADTQIDIPGFGGGGFTPNHAAFTLIAVGILGLWAISIFFRGVN